MASTDYEITDKIKFFPDARFAQSKTTTFLAGIIASFGCSRRSCISPPPTVRSIRAYVYKDPGVVANVLANPALYRNPNYIAHGQPGAKHPVPVDMAILLNSRARCPPRRARWRRRTIR